MQDFLRSTLEHDRQKLEDMTLWKRIVNLMKDERKKYSRKCEIDKEVTYSQGVLFGLDIFLGKINEKGVGRTSILEKACTGVPE